MMETQRGETDRQAETDKERARDCECVCVLGLQLTTSRKFKLLADLSTDVYDINILII